MAEVEAVCTAAHAVDLSDGRTLLPGEYGSVDPKEPHNAALFSSGLLTERKQEQKADKNDAKNEGKQNS